MSGRVVHGTSLRNYAILEALFAGDSSMSARAVNIALSGFGMVESINDTTTALNTCCTNRFVTRKGEVRRREYSITLEGLERLRDGRAIMARIIA